MLIQPVAWRNVCSLATLNQWAGKRVAGRALGTGLIGSGALTLAAFALILPSRPLFLDQSGVGLGIALAGLGVLALGSGLFIRDRGGFCHALCPVLPAERLYGVAPTIHVEAVRCDACSVCTPRGCPELAGEKALPQLLGPARKRRSWPLTLWGFGFLAFPGVVAAFFTVPEAAADVPVVTYGWIWFGGLVTWAIFGVAAAALTLPPRPLVLTSAATAFSLYYWFTAPGLVAFVGGPDVATWALRLALIILAIWWWWTRLGQGSPGRRGPGPGTRAAHTA